MQNTLMMPTQRDFYGLKLLVSLILLLMLLSYTSFYLIQNYYSKSFLEYNFGDKQVYFLESDTVKAMHIKNNMDYEGYKKRIQYFENLAQKDGYNTKNIFANKLNTLSKNSMLVVLDAMSLTTQEITDIDTFVQKGGKIIFNFTSGFLNSSLIYREDNLVKKITGLTLDSQINTIKYDRNSTGYTSTVLLSPITKNLPNGQALELVVYDPLPIFVTPKNIAVDAYLTNWSQVNYMTIGKKKDLTQKQSAIVWHGYKEAGKWVYFSFPSYSFLEVNSIKYAKLFQGMLEFLHKEVSVDIYPYIDAKSVVFISEDTEYKYENLEQFYTVAEKNKFPVTAFCVANLAQKHKYLMEKVSRSKYLEIGSHSYTHKKIVGESDAVYEKETQGSKKLLHKLSTQAVYGFRPPREEIDDKMIHLLESAQYKYILSAGENRLTPYFMKSIMVLPRHGTDDYSYLVNLDWDSKKILDEMILQVNAMAALNGIYTLSTHTHLMSYASNINIVDKFMQYVNTDKALIPMNGKKLYDRIVANKNLRYTIVITPKNIVMKISNSSNNSVKNVHYEIYVDSDIKLINVESEIIGMDVNIEKSNNNKYTLLIKSLKPQSQITLFINYVSDI